MADIANLEPLFTHWSEPNTVKGHWFDRKSQIKIIKKMYNNIKVYWEKLE